VPDRPVLCIIWRADNPVADMKQWMKSSLSVANRVLVTIAGFCPALNLISLKDLGGTATK
jgi:hypothetical protein